MSRFNTAARAAVIQVMSRHGFRNETKSSGEDRYEKNLMFTRVGSVHPIFIRKDTATDTGEPRYYKVAFHPDTFNPAWAVGLSGVSEMINSRWNANRHSSSNYVGFPIMDGNDEPVGCCLRIDSLDALDRLAMRLGTPLPVNPESVRAATATTGSPSPVRVHSVREPIESGAVDRALIIDEPAISRILAGEKTWEMRSTETSVRGRIGLIAKGSGTVVGTAELVDVIPDLSEEDMIRHGDRHRISAERLASGQTAKWRTAWVLQNARRLPTPIAYEHPSGAVIWVRLDPAIGRRL